MPNLTTVLALCLGLTAVRLAIEGNFEFAVAAVLAAAVLDAVDGRLARLLNGASKFGAEFDSLADFVNFGVVPGLLLYFWTLNALGALGWIAVLVFATAMALRLARFNVMLEDPSRPDWMGDFFVGLPAPAGATAVMLPLYLSFSGMPALPAAAVAVYVLGLAALTISRVPVYSGKKSGLRLPRVWMLPALLFASVTVALLMSYPWGTFAGLTITSLASIPLGVLHYRRIEQRHRRDISRDEHRADTQAATLPLPAQRTGRLERRLTH
jgi:CDP-diacylglycerol--serine O-phosphatidyltransferase